MKKIITLDDLDAAAGAPDVEADTTVLLMLENDRVELDLTEAHAKELRELLAPYFAAAQPAEPPSATRQPAGRRPQGGSGRQASPYVMGMRAFADARGISYQRRPGAKPYYTAELKARYEQHLKAQGGQ